MNSAGGPALGRPPVEADLDEPIGRAVEVVRACGVTGQAVTPAVLTEIEELSDGRSVAVNQALIADNAGLAAEVAVAYAAA